MKQTLRKYLIAGNWKMNKNSAEAVDLAKEVDQEIGQQLLVSVCICPPFTAIEGVARTIEDSNIQLGAQNMYHETAGAYTGEVSPEFLRHLFCAFVILGHSERREYFHEDDAFINKKVIAALANNLKPILCVGETLEQREADETMSVIESQLEGGLKDVTTAQAEQLVIAYEPVWAIGTGKTATPEMAQEVHGNIRAWLSNRFEASVAEKIRILYGGSMKPENADELLDQADIDGGLIGGAALKPRAFAGIVKSALKRAS